MLPERWLPIAGQPGYEVSDCGHVRSYIMRARSELRSTPRPLKPSANRGGYQIVRLHGKKAFFVHRLVMQAFVGTVPDGHEVDHMDNDPSNNHLANLQYVTRAQNYALRYARRRSYQCGHPVAGNTYRHRDVRTCLKCRRKAWRDAATRKRQAVAA